MAIFSWEAKGAKGDERSGEIEADNKDSAQRKLESQGLRVTKLKRKINLNLELKMPGDTGVTSRDLVVFTRQFATMIDAGLPLVQCLEILSGQSESPEFRKILTDVRGTVEGGKTLATALGKHPKVFNKLFVNLVAAGEASGVLDTILNRLANYTEKNMKLIKQVKGALTYPTMIVGVSFVVTLVLLLFVIPIFEKMFTDMGGALPDLTQFVVDISHAVQDHVFLIVGGVVGAGIGLASALKSPTGRRVVDQVVLQVPIAGPLVKKVAVAKFTRTMGTMLQSGVNILDALEIVAATSGNSVIEAGLMTVRQKISEGKSMAQPLGEMKLFPQMVVQMISVGEATGAMDTMLTKIADFYDDEVDSAIAQMMAMIEPLIMAFLAVVLGGLVVAMYLPVFSMAGGVQG